MPIKISNSKSTESMFEPFSWSPSNESQDKMPIITPTDLTQNGAQNINKKTFEIIQKETRKGIVLYIVLDYCNVNTVHLNVKPLCKSKS